jgi:TetR/AcrR family transcriptional repressor of nem operon
LYDNHHIKTFKPMRYTTEHKQQTREKLLGIAAAAIRTQGPDRIGVAGVMAKAGLTHGGFYAHFASKEDLIGAAIDRMFEESRARIGEETRGLSPREGLVAYIDFYLSARHRDTRGAGCALAALAGDLPRLSLVTRRRFAVGVQRMRQILAATLRLLERDDADVLADSMLAELVGALAIARAEPDSERSDAILAHSRAALKRRFQLAPSA